MAHFPVFLDLNGALVYVVGSDLRKEEILRSFGAEVQALETLTDGDLDNDPQLVVLASGDRDQLSGLCRSRKIPVNSVDDPKNCTFFFPSLFRRGDATVAVSSGGAAPAAARELKRRIETAMPENLEEILPWLAELTGKLRRSIPDYDTRAKLLEQITREAFEKGRPLTREEIANI